MTLNRLDSAALLRMESAALQGKYLDAALLEQIPTIQLKAMPLLFKAHCENLVASGKLAEAREGLNEITKRIAESGLRGSFLSALSLLAIVNIRMGLLYDAEPIIRFLRDEWDSAEEETGGDVAHAIARGLFLLDEETADAERYYRAAIMAHDRDGLYERGSFALLDMIMQEQNGMSQAAWEERLTEMAFRVRRGQIGKPYLAYLQALRMLVQGDKSALGEHTSAEIGEMTYAYQVMDLLLKCRIAIDQHNKEEAAARIASLQTLHLDSSADLECQFEWTAVQFAYSIMQEDKLAARLFIAQAQGTLNQGLSPCFRLRINQMNSTFDKLNVSMQYANWMKKQPDLKVQLFGAFTFIRGEQRLQDLPWKRKKTKELAMFLLLQHDYAASREQIAEALYPDAEPAKMANQLYVAAHQLKSVFRLYFGVENGVIIKDGIVRISDGWIDGVDVERYHALVRVADQLWLQDRELAAMMYEEAACMYAYAATDSPYTDWMEPYREQLLRMQCELLRRISKHAFIEGQYDRAETYGRQWVGLTPVDEDANQELLRILMRQGKQAEAESMYRLFEMRLDRELGLNPLSETLAIMRGEEK